MKKSRTPSLAAGLAVAAAACLPACAPATGGGDSARAPVPATASGSAASALAVREGELLVRFAAGAIVDGRPPAALLDAHALGVRRCSEPLDACALTFDAKTRSLEDVARALRSAESVESVLPAYLCEAAAPSDPDLLPIQWNLYAAEVADVSTPADAALGATIVALLDTGVLAVPGLAGVPLVSPYDFVSDDTDATDDHRHGTHLAGVLSDATPSAGTRAVSPGLAIMPVKVLDALATGTELDLAEGILWAVDHGASVINLSLAFPPGFYPSKTLQDAVAYAESAGVLMVAAAGNAGLDTVAYPAAFRPVIAVGASKVDPATVPAGEDHWSLFLTADDLLRTTYSNHGGLLDVLAPGGVLDEDLNGDTVVDGILAQTFSMRLGVPQIGYWVMAGTSHATAHVSSVVARALANYPGLSADEVRAWIASTSARDDHASFDPARGFGYLRGDDLLHVAATASKPPRVRDFYAGVSISIRTDGGGGTVGDATVEVLRDTFKKASHVTVIGSWIGAAAGTVSGLVDANGIVRFTSPPLVAGGCAIGFQVEAILLAGGRMVRPRGFTGIKLDALNLLQSGAAQIMGDLPTIVTFPTLLDPTLVGTITLANFGPGLSTPPTAIAVESGCFGTNFPALAGMTLDAGGALAGGPALSLDPASAFPVTIVPPAITFPGIDLEVVTFDPANGANPLHVDTDGAPGAGGLALRGAIQEALDGWWAFFTAAGPMPAAGGPGPSLLSDAEVVALGEFVAGYLAYVAGDEDESVDVMPDIVSVTAVALPTGTTASSAYLGEVAYP